MAKVGLLHKSYRENRHEKWLLVGWFYKLIEANGDRRIAFRGFHFVNQTPGFTACVQ